MKRLNEKRNGKQTGGEGGMTWGGKGRKGKKGRGPVSAAVMSASSSCRCLSGCHLRERGRGECKLMKKEPREKVRLNMMSK